MAAARESAIDDVEARLRAGEPRTLSRVLTRIESGDPDVQALLEKVYRSSGKARVVGVTGVPGAGKSTLLARLAQELRGGHPKIALLVVDPSSPLTGGAILGDRVRMTALTADPGIFIRSMATRGAVGGLARATFDAVDVLEAAGFGIVLVETVGVGQSELEIAHAADTTVLVSAPGLGDEVQAIKAGVLEMADIHVVNKADRPDAQRTFLDIQSTLAISPSRRRARVPVLLTAAESGQGIDALAAAIADHLAELEASGEGDRRRRHRAELRVQRAAEGIVASRIHAGLRGAGQALVEAVHRRERSPAAAALALLARLDAADGG